MRHRRLAVPAQSVGEIIKAAPSGRVVAERVQNAQGSACDSATARTARSAPGSAHDSPLHGLVDNIEIRGIAGNMRVGIVSGIGIAVDRLGLK